MSAYLLKSKISYRVETMAEADSLEQNFRKNGNFEVARFDKKQKQHTVKEKDDRGKVIDAYIDHYVLCEITLEFNDEKNPLSDVNLLIKTQDKESKIIKEEETKKESEEKLLSSSI